MNLFFRDAVKSLLVFSVGLGVCLPKVSLAQSSSMTNEQLEAYTEVCAITDSSKTPSQISAIDAYVARAGLSSDKRSDLVKVCLAYLDGWKQGFHSSSPDESKKQNFKEICSRFMRSAMAGDPAWLNRYIEQSSFNAVDKVSLVSYCDAFKEGTTFGVKTARDMMTGSQ